jgi:hypothetical protein
MEMFFCKPCGRMATKAHKCPHAAAPSESAAKGPDWNAHEQEKVLASPPGTLTKPAQVGGTRFGVGISERTVIARAQREYEYQNTPEKEAERMTRFRSFVQTVGNIGNEDTPVDVVSAIATTTVEHIPEYFDKPGVLDGLSQAHPVLLIRQMANEIARLRALPSARAAPTWAEEELKDGDRICEAAGVQRTEGGRLPVQKIINKLKAAS